MFARRTLLGAAGALAILAGRSGAQLAGTIDAGWSRVAYDGFLPAHSASISAAVRFDRPEFTLSGRGTALRFETGNVSVSGTAGASLFTRAYHALRAELSGFVGANRYEDLAQYGHALARVRVHASDASRGLWLQYTGGARYVIGSGSGVSQGGAGAWTRRGLTTVTLSAATAATSHARYTDAEATARWTRRRVDLDATTGIRVLSRGAGRGVFGEAAATWWVAERFGVNLSGGRYPSDPVHGTISGRYVALGVHLGTRGVRPALAVATVERDAPRAARPLPYAGAVALGLDVVAGLRGWRTFRLHASGAHSVELMADFTDWQPVAMGRAGERTWQVTLPVRAGLHRLNVRLNGGEWTVPLGLATVADEFGGVVALIVVD